VPLLAVDVMQVPGAAISTAVPQFENPAVVSSGCTCWQVVWPPWPPGSPSESARADTVMTSGWAAGWNVEASTRLLPAATTYTTPASTERVMASVIAGFSTVPPRLMLTASITSARAVT
jgi:hypothetical protein